MKKFIEFLIESEEIDREEVRRVLGHNKFEIINGKVNVNTSANLSNQSLKSIPFSFNIVNRYFNCSNNQLTTLNGCPKIVNWNFCCDNNQLTSLEGCPEIVNGDFCCNYNQLTSLEGCPKEIKQSFYCAYNQLTSLEGCPNVINSDFYCNNNPLVDISDIIGKEIKYLNCDWNKLNITVDNCKALKQAHKTKKINWYLNTYSEEELQLYAIKKDPKNVRKIPDILNSVIKIIKRDYPELIRYLPYDKQTKLSRYGL